MLHSFFISHTVKFCTFCAAFSFLNKVSARSSTFHSYFISLCYTTKHQYKFPVCEKLRLKLLALFSLRGISTSEHLLELFGTSGLSYVITLQRQLAAHDLDEVFRKQTCRRQEMLKTAENYDIQAACVGPSVDCSRVTDVTQRPLLSRRR